MTDKSRELARAGKTRLKQVSKRRWTFPAGRVWLRHIRPLLIIEEAAARLWMPTPPLLEEEGHIFTSTAVAQVQYPLCSNRPMPRPGLTTGNEPVNTFEA